MTGQKRAHRYADFTVLIIISLFIAWAMNLEQCLLQTTPAGGDMSSHFTALHFLKNRILPDFRVIGWSYGNYAGFPLFQFYFPLPFLITAVAGLVVPLETAFKFMCVGSVIMLPFCIYRFATSLRFPFPAPALAAVFTMPFLFNDSHSMWGGNILSVLSGEFNYQIAFALSFFLAGILYSTVLHKRGRVVPTAILMSIVGLSHGVGIVMVAAMSLFFLIKRKGLTARVLCLLKIYGLSICLMAFWLFPFLAGAKWSTKYNLLWRLSGLSEVFPPMMYPFLICGGIALVADLCIRLRQKKELARISHRIPAASAESTTARARIDKTPDCSMFIRLLRRFTNSHPRSSTFHALTTKFCEICGLAPYLYMVFAGVMAAVLYETGYELNVVDIRFLPYLEMLVLLLSAVALGNLAASLRRKALIPLIALAATVVWALPYTKQTASLSAWNFSGFENKHAFNEFRAINEFLDGGPNDPRVAYEHSMRYRRFGSVRAFESLPFFSGRGTLEGLYMQSSISTPFVFYLQSEISAKPSAPLPQYDYTRPDLERALGHFRLFNVGHYIAESPAMRVMAEQNESLTCVFSQGDLAIYDTGFTNSYVEPLVLKPLLQPMENWRRVSYKWFRLYSPDPRHVLFVNESDRKRLHHSYGFPLEPGLQAPDEMHRENILTPAAKVRPKRISISNATAGQPLLIKISYHPKWRCKNADGPYLISPCLMMIIPRKGEVEVVYGRGIDETVGLLVSILAIILCCLPASSLTAWLRADRQIGFLQERPLLLRWLHKGGWLILATGVAGFVCYQRTHNPSRLARQAQSAYNAKDYDTAAGKFGRIIQIAPESSYADNASYFRAIILWKKQDYSAAAEAFKLLICQYEASNLVPEAIFHLGLCYREMGNYAKAAETWNRLLQEHAESSWSGYAEELLKQLPSKQTATEEKRSAGERESQ